MRFLFFVAIVLISCGSPSSETVSSTTEVTDYLSVPGPIKYNDKNFSLAWSDHPTEIYYLQEYLPEGQSVERFYEMMTIHLFLSEISIDDAVAQKIAEIEERKLTDPEAKYSKTENPVGDDVMLEFMVSSKENEVILEYNIYHYSKADVGDGLEALRIMAYSRRDYNDEIPAFMDVFEAERSARFYELIGLEKPEIKLSAQ